MRFKCAHPCWPHLLTDWCVIRAFERAGCPGYLRKPPALAAAFVAEVSAVIRSRTFSFRTAELIGLLQGSAESAYEKFGGSAYCALREQAATAEDAHLRSWSRSPDLLQQRELCDAALNACRQRMAAEAEAGQRRCARAYWADQRGQWLQSDLFARLPNDHPILRLAHLTPVWWDLFCRCLQSEFSRRDLTCFHLLDELPRLRQQAKQDRKKVLAALVDEWRAARTDQLGLPARLHYHVLERRGQIRARYVQNWFQSRVRSGGKDYATMAELLEFLPSVPGPKWGAN